MAAVGGPGPLWHSGGRIFRGYLRVRCRYAMAPGLAEMSSTSGSVGSADSDVARGMNVRAIGDHLHSSVAGKLHNVAGKCEDDEERPGASPEGIVAAMFRGLAQGGASRQSAAAVAAAVLRTLCVGPVGRGAPGGSRPGSKPSAPWSGLR